MKINERFRRSVGELGIVVLGVMIALAADSWREDWLDARVEVKYLERLRDDVSAGLSAVRVERETYQSVMEAAAALTEGLEDNLRPVTDDYLVDNLVAATQMGFGRNEMASDVTYRELIASGQLNLIKNYEVRESVVAYYRNAELLITNLESLPSVNNTFSTLTGYFPIEIANDNATLTPHDRSRLLVAIREDPNLTAQLRRLHAEAYFNDRVFEKVIMQGQELLLLLE
jgi:hypothetical protein